MRFANLNWNDSEVTVGGFWQVNVGNLLQVAGGVANLYDYMKIDKTEIIYLSIAEMPTYEGEEVILPLNGALFDQHWMQDGKIVISKKIHPVYLAMHLGCNYKEEYFNEHNMEYLKKHAPIGCRDMEAKRVLEQHGISAYVNGCLTVLLPQRKKESDFQKVFLIDAPKELEKVMPETLKENCEIMSQQLYLPNNMLPKELEELVYNHYKKIETAKLVITSRLHVAAPCVAMGIPVIFAKKVIDSRFEWLHKYIPLYKYEDFGNIDWHPQPLDYEDDKKNILEYNKNRILAERYKLDILRGMEKYYSSTEERLFPNFASYIKHNWMGVKQFITQMWNKEKDYNYAIWGLTSSAEELVDFIEKEYPKAKLKYIVDNYKVEKQWKGTEIIKASELRKEDIDCLLVLSVMASNEAYSLCKKMNMRDSEYYLVGEVFI